MGNEKAEILTTPIERPTRTRTILTWTAPPLIAAAVPLVLLVLIPSVLGVCIVVMTVGLFFSPLLLGMQDKRKRTRIVLCAFSFLLSSVAASKIEYAIRMKAFADLAERSRPLIQSIRSYQADKGDPPTTLEALVPVYLASVPETGIRNYPRYNYEIDPERYNGNPWAIDIPTPYLMSSDRFLYFPLSNYPERGYGGRLERVGDWAYVHE